MNLGENVMSKLHITYTQSYYECGDGCCTDWNNHLLIESEHTKLVNEGVVDCDMYLIEKLLKALGHEVEVTEIDTTAEDMELYR